MFSKILLAVDGSEFSTRAVAPAAEIATKFGGEVLVLHVRAIGVGHAVAFELETMDEASGLVDGVVRTLKDAGISARGEIVTSIHGREAREILDVAKAEDVDLTVMGSRGLGGLVGAAAGKRHQQVLHGGTGAGGPLTDPERVGRWVESPVGRGPCDRKGPAARRACWGRAKGGRK